VELEAVEEDDVVNTEVELAAAEVGINVKLEAAEDDVEVELVAAEAEGGMNNVVGKAPP